MHIIFPSVVLAGMQQEGGQVNPPSLLFVQVPVVLSIKADSLYGL